MFNFSLWEQRGALYPGYTADPPRDIGID